MDRWVKRAEEPQPIDDTPVEMPVVGPESTSETIARLISEHLQREAISQGFGTWEDEEDFEDEDPNLLDFSPYELDELQSDELLPDPSVEDPVPPGGEVTTGQDEEKASVASDDSEDRSA